MFQVPHKQQKMKLPADVERAALIAKHKQPTYTMLSDDDDDDDDRVTTARQVSTLSVHCVVVTVIAWCPLDP